MTSMYASHPPNYACRDHPQIPKDDASMDVSSSFFMPIVEFVGMSRGNYRVRLEKRWQARGNYAGMLNRLGADRKNLVMDLKSGTMNWSRRMPWRGARTCKQTMCTYVIQWYLNRDDHISHIQPTTYRYKYKRINTGRITERTTSRTEL